MGREKDYIRDNLKKEDLSAEQRTLLDLLGIDIYLDMCEKYGGMTLYVAQLENLGRQLAIKDLLENKDLYKQLHMTKKQLAAMYGLSLATIFKIMKESTV